MTSHANARPLESAPSAAYLRLQRWLANPARLGGEAEAAHIGRHGDCPCLEDLWLPTSGGYSDISGVERCDLCDIRFYEAYGDSSRIRRQDVEEFYGPLSEAWAGILTFAFLQAPAGQEPWSLVVCGCCWDTYSSERARTPETTCRGAPAGYAAVAQGPSARR